MQHKPTTLDLNLFDGHRFQHKGLRFCVRGYTIAEETVGLETAESGGFCMWDCIRSKKVEMSLRYFFLFDAGYLLGMGVWLVALAVSLFWLLRKRQQCRKQLAQLKRIHVVLSVWTVLATFTAIELYFAFFYDTTDSFNRTNVSQKWYRMHSDPEKRPLEIAEGTGFYYRDNHDFPKSPADGQQRICFFGDSFTFGHGIRNMQDRFTDRVGAALERTHPGRFQVTNMADAGTDLHWVEAQLEALFTHDFKIDLVIYVMCLNDIETFDKRHETYYINFGKRIGDPKFFLFTKTYFFNLMYYRLRYFVVPELHDYYSFVREYYETEPWELMKQKLSDVQHLCQTHGADFRIVVFPFLHNLTSEYPFHHAHQLIDAYCREKGIPFLDLEPVLASHVQEGLTVNPFDAHPNELAHKLVADAILKQLLPDLVQSGHLPTEKSGRSREKTPAQ